MSRITFGRAIHDALQFEMRRCPEVYLAGEDVGFRGGDFGEDMGLWAEFDGKHGAESRRVVDTAISETAIIGHAVGAAACGLRPVVEIMHMDFIGVAMDEILNQAGKMRYMNGGKLQVPMVIKTTAGGGVGAAAQHSQMLEAFMAHTPGVKVVMPSNPADAKGLLISAVRDNNPVVFISHKLLMASKGEVPDGEYIVPIGKANVCREGNDVTIVSWSKMVKDAMQAASKLAEEGIDSEVIDLRTIKPLDEETVLSSVKKTGRLVIVHEATRVCGFGAEVAAVVAEKAFEALKAPIQRITAPDCPSPFTPALEKEYLPNAEKVIAAVKKII
ncbi:MAG: alpha-ketoacid dehydrogenase subunit beta [Aeriscardovia sp.]|nr:alpha-ketoacid dehydrogenase subunit beta [Aeriscardovia sp.]